MPQAENQKNKNVNENLKSETDFWSVLSTNQQNEIKRGIRQLDSGKRISF